MKHSEDIISGRRPRAGRTGARGPLSAGAAIFTLGLFLTLGGCQQGGSPVGTYTPVEVSMSTRIESFGNFPSGDPATGLAEFAQGDAIGITVISDGIIVRNNVRYVYSDGGWVPASESAAIDYEADGQYLVYYPYDPGINGMKTEAEIASAFRPARNQGTYDAYSDSDLLIWSGQADRNGDNAELKIEFDHALSLVVVYPQKNEAHTTISDVSVSVTAGGVTYQAYDTGADKWQALIPASGSVYATVSYRWNGTAYDWNSVEEPAVTSAGEYTSIFYDGIDDPGPDPDPDPDPDDYYYSAYGKSGNSLKLALRLIIDDHTNVGYDGLYRVYEESDTRSDGSVWDMYTDNPSGTTKYYFYHGSKKCGQYSKEGDCYNREHSVPQSWFGEKSPMRSDAFHVYPTDGYVNNRRSNYSFGEVSSATWTSSNGSKVGKSGYSGYSGTVFEPIDAYKGDFARTYFYMATRYNTSSWGGDMFNSSGDFSSWALRMLLEWHREDPVSSKETVRNNAVFKYQKNRNPFIDHPELAEHIWGTKTSEPFNPQ